MALSRIKTWVSGEVLTASDLNAEFNNPLNNALSLISPLTGALDLDGNELILDGDADTSITASTDDRIDFRFNGVDLFRMDGTVTSPVNGLDFIARATGSPPILRATGESNIGFQFQDSNSNEVLIGASTASAINEVTITNAAIGNNPQVEATGGDTNISLNLVAKGSGVVQAGGTEVATTGANTFTADQILQSTDAGASVGPTLSIDRNSSSPAAGDDLGRLECLGRSSTGITRAFARFKGELVDPTNTAEAGQWRFQTMIAGVSSDRLILGNGLFTPTATGGDQGANTINASSIFDDGVQILVIPQATQADIEAQTNGDTYMPPDLAKHLPGVAKAWCQWEQDGTHAILASENITSVTDGGGVGDTDLVIATDFSGSNYAILATGGDGGGSDNAFLASPATNNPAAGTLTINMHTNAGAGVDLSFANIALFGDQ